MIIRITQREINLADYMAEVRSFGSRQDGLQHRHALPVSEGPESDRVGTLGELAVAKALNLYWSGVEAKNAVDVGWLVEVRAVPKPRYSLILHADTDKPLPFVLADVSRTRSTGEARLCGWEYFNEGIRAAIYRTDIRSPCHLLRQELLRKVEELRRYCHLSEAEGFTP